MKCLQRNQSPLYYATYEGDVYLQDEQGNFTGEHGSQYSNPTKIWANISATKGETQTRQFGEDLSYDKVVVLEKGRSKIDEFSVLWVDVAPALKEDGSTETPHDYIVKRVADSLNVTSLAISKVQVNG